MGSQEYVWADVSPSSGGPVSSVQREENWREIDDSMNSVSFGFVATAVLLSLFLFMAIFERFLRVRPSMAPVDSSVVRSGDLEAAHVGLGSKSSSKISSEEYGRGVPVLMPGEEIPTFIAHPSPSPGPSHHFSPSS
ncbi:hypothetical protein Sjap_025568 [Stephania japonica]|uniref:Uncharacterized protein n=1 Tax=Stephania japonica TaxID=461633 RepID=A0AAP0E6D2_9MAGN